MNLSHGNLCLRHSSVLFCSRNELYFNHIVSYSCTVLASMWQHPLNNQKLFFSVFLIFFRIFFSFVDINFGFRAPLKLLSDRLFLSGLRVFLLSERLLSTLAFTFCNDRQLFTTFDNKMYFISPAAFPIWKTLAQYVSICLNFPSYSINQLSAIFSTCSSLNWSCTNVTSRSVITWGNNSLNLLILATDIVFLRFAGSKHFRYIKREASKGRDFCRFVTIFT